MLLWLEIYLGESQRVGLIFRSLRLCRRLHSRVSIHWGTGKQWNSSSVKHSLL